MSHMHWVGQHQIYNLFHAMSAQSKVEQHLQAAQWSQ